LVLMLLCGMVQAAQDTFFATLDAQGAVVQGGGSGYYEQGNWFYYPNSGWWNQWFYDGPLDPAGKKTINISVVFRPLEPTAASRFELALNWTDARWSTGATGAPPIKSPDEQYIVRTTLFSGPLTGPQSMGFALDISDLCPEWVSIDIRGVNVVITDGTIDHVCVSPEPRQACCLPDGTCVNTTAQDCLARNGTPQGPGTDCSQAPCSCQWQEGDDHKMHWPQLPKAGGLDISFGSGMLADDWQCSRTGPVDDLHFWISWNQNAVAQIPGFWVTIYSDLPDPDGDGPLYSEPGRPLWARFFGPGDFIVRDMPPDTQGWFDPVTGQWKPGDHTSWQQIDVCHIADPFIQQEGTIYWLAIEFGQLPGIGWKQSGSTHFNDDAVWSPASTDRWIDLHDPQTRESIDLAFVITGGQGTPVPEPLKWEQPPIEWDPLATNITLCGWDEPSYDEKIPGTTESSASYPADDFRCLGPMPVTSIHWWGSYQDWQEQTLPAVGPDAWRITFWGDTPVDANNPYSRPGKMVWQFEVDPSRVSIQPVGFDRFPNQPSDSGFVYSLTLDPKEYFWQQRYQGDVFWISIAAVYKTQRPDHVWGWKTRPWSWMDGAVRFVSQLTVTPSGLPISAIFIEPIQELDACGQIAKYDMAFTLDTDPNYVKWQQPFTGLRDWPHYEDEPSASSLTQTPGPAIKWLQEPDLSKTGVDMDATTDIPPLACPEILADDYQCTIPGPVTQIDIWGSWYQDILIGNDANNATFTLSIRKDVPATSMAAGHSMPGAVLWSKVFSRGQFTVEKGPSEIEGFAIACDSSYEANNHQTVYKYTFTIDPKEAFVQEGTADKPVVYWLSVQAQLIHPPGSEATRFGWKTSLQPWNDDAVWVQAEEPYSGVWQKLDYPAKHPLLGAPTALAFDIITSSQTSSTVATQVADDWLCTTPTPVIVAVWWGSYIGYEYQACGCNDEPLPVKPDYFLLSIWSDVPKSNPNDFSHPGTKLWEYRATDFDEVLVGFDKHPEQVGTAKGREPVFRYSVSLPVDQWFYQKGATTTYWFSVLAVYNGRTAPPYPWGWTNHQHSYNDDAVTGSYGTLTGGVQWTPLADQTGASEDMSFVLFQQRQTLAPPVSQ
jgi:hypothetical protein